MSTPLEAMIQRGDFVGVLAILTQQNATAADPGQLLMQFNFEVRLQRFADAQTTMRRLFEVAPHAISAMEPFARAARAEAAATARLTDAALAGKRASIGAPPPYGMAYVKAAVLHAQKDYAGAAAAIKEAASLTPAMTGTLSWTTGRTARFVSLIDTDELTGSVLPCYDGDAVLDIAYTQLRSITFVPGRSSLDAMWLPAEIVTADGKKLMLRVPALYAGTGVASLPQVRTGQMTTWERASGYAIGVGQRDFKLATEDGRASVVGILQVRRIELDPQPGAETEDEKPKSFWSRLFG